MPGGVPDHEATRRRRAVAAAGLEGPAAEETVRRAMADPEPAVRATALGALDRIRRLTVADVEAALSDPSPVVVSRAAEVAARLGPDAAPLLIGLLAGAGFEVTDAACHALGEIGPELAGGPAARALAGVVASHPDPLCRESAVAALGAIADPAGLGAILAAMADKPAVRRRAVLALAAFEGPHVDAALEAARADRDWQVRQAAEDLTGRGR